ncbi:hypothetical protein XBO1_2120017 [Xenorhabdus bovienii str. oregonense]|uniref:Uncharacterized protein n=1 Tax=Xenorhabdus bovienii str. oregonense TaxID=1398202 RepID=A0A077P4Y5_XENBV|nr:hypothetical protein XBO1_2120017 [Xenorhabdus bovienii str. oregonense]
MTLPVWHFIRLGATVILPVTVATIEGAFFFCLRAIDYPLKMVMILTMIKISQLNHCERNTYGVTQLHSAKGVEEISTPTLKTNQIWILMILKAFTMTA